MALVLTTQSDPGTATWTEGGTIDQQADPGDGGAIAVTESSSVALVTAGAETRTVGNPSFAGQTLALFFETDGGDCVVTFASGINVAANTVATFANATESLIVQAVVSTTAGGLAWRITHIDGPALS
jgi:hypothetical protein